MLGTWASFLARLLRNPTQQRLAQSVNQQDHLIHSYSISRPSVRPSVRPHLKLWPFFGIQDRRRRRVERNKASRLGIRIVDTAAECTYTYVGTGCFTSSSQIRMSMQCINSSGTNEIGKMKSCSLGGDCLQSVNDQPRRPSVRLAAFLQQTHTIFMTLFEFVSLFLIVYLVLLLLLLLL